MTYFLTLDFAVCEQIIRHSKKDSKDQELIQSSTDTKLESNKITINITNNIQKASPFPSGNQKAAMNKCESMTNTRHK